MERNPYAAPTTDDAQTAALEGQPWFAVGGRKLLVMSFFTFGLYMVHWFERQYHFQKKVRKERTIPLARGIFSVFFANDLFRRVEVAANQVDVEHGWNASAMTSVFIVSAVLNRILDRASAKLTGPTSNVLAMTSLLFIAGFVYPLFRVQGTVNEVLARTNPGFERNESFTVWNWILIGLGGLFLVLVAIGLAMPDG